MLNLSGRDIGSSGMKRLADSCTNPRPSTIITPVRNQEEEQGEEKEQVHHQRRTYTCPLVILWMDNNDLYPTSMEDLVRVIRVSPSLRHLHLAYNSIGDIGIQTLVESTIFGQLQSLDIANNNIGSVGAQIIGKHLQHDQCCILQRLNLNGNQLRDDGILNIVEGLKGNTSLKSVDLRYNDISIHGLIAIRDMLMNSENTTLEMIDLEEEEWEDDDDDDSVHNSEDGSTRTTTSNSDESSSNPSYVPSVCDCHNRCQIMSMIHFYLNLNRSGRHSYQDHRLIPALWSRILAKSSKICGHDDDPSSLLYTVLSVRPDILAMQ